MHVQNRTGKISPELLAPRPHPPGPPLQPGSGAPASQGRKAGGQPGGVGAAGVQPPSPPRCPQHSARFACGQSISCSLRWQARRRPRWKAVDTRAVATALQACCRVSGLREAPACPPHFGRWSQIPKLILVVAVRPICHRLLGLLPELLIDLGQLLFLTLPLTLCAARLVMPGWGAARAAARSAATECDNGATTRSQCVRRRAFDGFLPELLLVVLLLFFFFVSSSAKMLVATTVGWPPREESWTSRLFIAPPSPCRRQRIAAMSHKPLVEILSAVAVAVTAAAQKKYRRSAPAAAGPRHPQLQPCPAHAKACNMEHRSGASAP